MFNAIMHTYLYASHRNYIIYPFKESSQVESLTEVKET